MEKAHLEVIMDVMGDYAQMASPAVNKSKYERHTTELAELQGRRLIFPLKPEKAGIRRRKMKWLTGGERVGLDL